MSDRRGLDKRKVWLFLALVAIGLLCVCLLIYALMYAKPSTSPAVQNGGHSQLREAKSSFSVHS